MVVNILVEGHVDEAVAWRLVDACGHQRGMTFGKRGWTYIQQKAQSFDRSCATTGLLAMVDFMDTKKPCAPAIVQDWLAHRHRLHVFRVVVREIESWVMADREAVARFLAVPVSKIPRFPELLDDPKRSLINLARHSRRKVIRQALVPAGGMAGHAASEGPLYSSELAGFVTNCWQPQRARECAPSLDTCLQRLSDLHHT